MIVITHIDEDGFYGILYETSINYTYGYSIVFSSDNLKKVKITATINVCREQC